MMMNDGGNNRYKMEFYVQAFNAAEPREPSGLRREPAV